MSRPILIVTIIIRYGDWTDIDYAVTKTRESYGYNNAVSIISIIQVSNKNAVRINIGISISTRPRR